MMSPPPPSPPPPQQYPQEIQLKLYQAFIFSIPILFSIILFLLFYLFYLKRRASTFSSTSRLLPTTSNDSTLLETVKNPNQNQLCRVLFDDYVEARDSMCCVCLGEFEVKEELVQVGACKHVYHLHCLRHWLLNNSTCPLCRAPVNHQPPTPPGLI